MDNEIKKDKSIEINDALEQSTALTQITKDLLETTQHVLKRVYIILVISILANLVIVGAFLWYESHMEFTETTTTTQTVDGESSINNIEGDQYKDSATHNDNRRSDSK